MREHLEMLGPLQFSGHFLDWSGHVHLGVSFCTVLHCPFRVSRFTLLKGSSFQVVSQCDLPSNTLILFHRISHSGLTREACENHKDRYLTLIYHHLLMLRIDKLQIISLVVAS